MSDSAGAPTREAYPGMAVAVSGWKELPNAGDEVLTGSEADVKKALANRRRKVEAEATLVDMEALNTQRMEERRNGEGVEEEVQKVETGPKELRLVIKGDVSGSVEAIEGALQGIGNKDAVVKIVSTGVGDVSESDVMMAKAVEGQSCPLDFDDSCLLILIPLAGMIIAFSVNIPRAIETIAASSKVSLYTSTIIYRVMEEVRSRVTALLPVIIEKKVTGEANVLELFNINTKGRQTKQVAGCRVVNGLVEKSRNARVVRDGVTIHEGRPLASIVVMQS
jgi:translation initiation factor IF-2